MANAQRDETGHDRPMTVLLDGIVHVHYGFISLAPDGETPDLMQARAGQVNGLCGGGVPRMLSMITGLHTGAIPFRIELHQQEPGRADDWEEVVEASIDIPEIDMTWAAFDESGPVRFEQTGSHRARYHASGMDAAHQADHRGDHEPEIDRYLLQLWPAPMAPDAILRQTSEHAVYWHRVAKGETA
jgi:hypothetical protein